MPENNDEPVRLMLCEQDGIVLKPGVLYLFEVDANCANCKRIALLLKG